MLRNILAVSIGLFTFAASPAAAQDQPSPAQLRPRNVAIVVHQGVELLDFAGPGEVFAAASHRGSAPEKGWFNIYTVAPASGQILSQGFVTIQPQYTIADCPRPDILVVPGGDTAVLLGDQRFMKWVSEQAQSREFSFSVCTGAFVFAQAGLLKGKQATTHQSAIEWLRREFPDVEVKADRRIVDNGGIITAGGVSAGIDGSLHLVARLLGRAVAEETARYMEYEWRPDPALTSSYSQFNPQLGPATRERQKAKSLLHERKFAEAAKLFEAIVKENPGDADAWYDLAYCVHSAGDIDRAIGLHAKAASFNFQRHRPLYNLACAYAVKGQKDLALAALSDAIDAGYADLASLRNDPDLQSIRSDPRFAGLLRKAEGSSSVRPR